MCVCVSTGRTPHDKQNSNCLHYNQNLVMGPGGARHQDWMTDRQLPSGHSIRALSSSLGATATFSRPFLLDHVTWHSVPFLDWDRASKKSHLNSKWWPVATDTRNHFARFHNASTADKKRVIYSIWTNLLPWGMNICWGYMGTGIGTSGTCCEHGSEPSDYIKGGEFID